MRDHVCIWTYLDCLEVFLLITLGKMDASIKQLGQTWHSSAQLQQLWAQVGLAVGGWRPGGNKRSSRGGGGRGRGQGWPRAKGVMVCSCLFGIPLDYENPVPYI